MEPQSGQPQERGPFDGSCELAEGTTAIPSEFMRTATAEAWADALAKEINERRRAECMARIQSDAVQLAIDLLVREPDISGFFRVFIKTLIEECESYACGVFLLKEDPAGGDATCDLWMAAVENRHRMAWADSTWASGSGSGAVRRPNRSWMSTGTVLC